MAVAEQGRLPRPTNLGPGPLSVAPEGLLVRDRTSVGRRPHHPTGAGFVASIVCLAHALWGSPPGREISVPVK